MEKKSKITLKDKLKVAFEYGQKKTYREIEYKLNISKSSVGRIIQFMMNDNQVKHQKYDFINPLRYHFVTYNLFKTPLISNKSIAKLSQEFEFQMSQSTVGRISQSLGFKSFFQQ